MGTINYATSNYITIGLKPYDYEDFEDENGNINYDMMNDYYQDDYNNIDAILNKYDFHYFHVVIKPGYYEGFSIDIENNYGVCYDSWQDRKEALKEATQIKLFLLECIDNGLCKCSPGWCTGYYDRAESVKAVKQAVKEMKEEIRSIPTWGYCERMGIEI